MKLSYLPVLGLVLTVSCGKDGSRKQEAPVVNPLPSEQPSMTITPEGGNEAPAGPNEADALSAPTDSIPKGAAIQQAGELFDFTNAQALAKIAPSVETVDLQGQALGLVDAVKSFKKIDTEGRVLEILQDAAKEMDFLIDDIKVSQKGRLLVQTTGGRYPYKSYVITSDGQEIELTMQGEGVFNANGDLVYVQENAQGKDRLFILEHDAVTPRPLSAITWDHLSVQRASGQVVEFYAYNDGQATTTQYLFFDQNSSAYRLSSNYQRFSGFGSTGAISHDGNLYFPTAEGTNKQAIEEDVYLISLTATAHHKDGAFYIAMIGRKDSIGVEHGVYYVDSNRQPTLLKTFGLGDVTDQITMEVVGDFAILIDKTQNKVDVIAKNGWSQTLLTGLRIERYNIINDNFYYEATGYDISKGFLGRVNIITGENFEIKFSADSKITDFVGLR